MASNKEFNPLDFREADISFVDYETQVLFFNVIKEEFTTLNMQEEILPVNIFAQKYGEKLMQIVEMAAGGIVPAQDYLCYIYKRGIDKILPRNLVRAHYWGSIACANGSKLSMERLRLFYEPVFDYVLQSEKVEEIVTKNELNQDNIAEFIAQNFSILFNQEMKIELLDTAKKPLYEDENFVKFSHDAEIAKKKVLPRLLELIA
ncbi:MAG: hypothetical protein J6C13_00230 [Clostridia bacterium]|nr:hypothetical protein [Clostridia bacterium]